MPLFLFDILVAVGFFCFAVSCFKKAAQISKEKKNNDNANKSSKDDIF